MDRHIQSNFIMACKPKEKVCGPFLIFPLKIIPDFVTFLYRKYSNNQIELKQVLTPEPNLIRPVSI